MVLTDLGTKVKGSGAGGMQEALARYTAAAQVRARAGRRAGGRLPTCNTVRSQDCAVARRTCIQHVRRWFLL